MTQKDEINVARGDLEQVREILDMFYHKSMAEDMIECYRKFTKSQFCALTRDAERMVSILDVYLKEQDDVSEG